MRCRTNAHVEMLSLDNEGLLNMKVLLIWPYNQYAIDVPVVLPLGLGYLMASKDLSRHDVRLMDCTLDRIAPQSPEFTSRIRAFGPEVIGISFWSQNAEAVYQTCELLRRIAPTAKIVFGGPHVSTDGQNECLSGRADYALVGEAERSFPQLLEAVESGSSAEHLSQVPGLIYLDGDGGAHRNRATFVEDLDQLGHVDYRSLRLSEYHQRGYHYAGEAVLHPGVKTATIAATRGCPYRCKFCAAPLVNGRRIRCHSPAYIANTIRSLYDDFLVRLVSLGDDNFTFYPDYALSVCEAIARLRLDDLLMSAPNGIRFSRMTPELLRAMKGVGFDQLTIAPESGSARTLRSMQKDVRLEDVEPFVRECEKVGIKVMAFFILGYPGETMEDVLLTERFIKQNSFAHIGLHLFQPLPGTPVFDDLVASGEIERSFVPGRYFELTYCPKGMNKEALCMAFNRIINDFRDSKGWKYENHNLGTIRG